MVCDYVMNVTVSLMMIPVLGGSSNILINAHHSIMLANYQAKRQLCVSVSMNCAFFLTQLNNSRTFSALAGHGLGMRLANH